MSNSLQWTHIMDKQPEHDRSIVEAHVDYKGCHTMGMRNYYQTCTWKELMKYYDDRSIEYPNFWWIYATDFPFAKANYEL